MSSLLKKVEIQLQIESSRVMTRDKNEQMKNVSLKWQEDIQ